jgi:WD40 repeat protein
VQVWDAATGTRLTSYLGHTSLQGRLAEVQAIAWSPDGKYIASGSRDNNDVHLWEAATGVRLRLLSLPEHDLDATGHLMGVLSLAWSPDGKYIASGSYKIVQIWNAATGAKLTSYLGHTSGVTSVAWSPDGKYIASGSRDLQVWEAMSTKLVSYGPHARGVYKVIWSPGGSRIATLSSGGICIWQAV